MTRLRRWVAAGLLISVVGSGCALGESTRAEAPTREAGGYPGAPEGAPAMMSDKDASEDGFGRDNAKTPQDAPKQAPQEEPSGAKTGNNAPSNGLDDPSRKSPILIYRAEFSLSVYEVEKSLDAVEGFTKEHGGYLSRRDDRSITVRVPAAKFQDLVAQIEKVGDVLHRDVVSEDVTAEYRDLEVQLQNQTALRLRFEKLLDKAVKAEEALAIEKELGRITGEIERIKGRLKLLTDLARYSTITVRFEPRSSQQVQQGPFVLPLPFLNQVGLRRLLSL